PEDSRPDPAQLAALFTALGPWSSVDLWIRRADERWLAQITLVPFGAPGSGVDPEEARIATAIVDAVLAGVDDNGQAAYGELLARFPDSPRAPSYRARLGRAPAHHGAVAMIELSVLGALVVPLLGDTLEQARLAEAPGETEAALAAALSLREKTGSCGPLVGKAGPTPPLETPCYAGDGGKCRPLDAAGGPRDAAAGEYDAQLWTEDPIWSAIGWRPSGGHRYHYAIEAQESPTDGCRVVVRAYGDLDGDGVFSTYTREATVAADGSRRSPAMQVEQGDE
ncbi:MAG: hypothetical protein KC431_14505, partial [Myxococcales bacterium]|nr:hypothetical protein [Myxococcales bacterium]